MNLVDRKDMRVLYMVNGLIIIAELVDNEQGIIVRNAIAFAPNPKQGGMTVFTAFTFTDLNEEIRLEPGSFITMTEIGDGVMVTQYLDALKQAKTQQSGLVMP